MSFRKTATGLPLNAPSGAEEVAALLEPCRGVTLEQLEEKVKQLGVSRMERVGTMLSTRLTRAVIDGLSGHADVHLKPLKKMR